MGFRRYLAGQLRRIRFSHKSFGKSEKEKGACALAER